MKLLILTESGPGIGFGHLNRCMAFADTWIEHGTVEIIDRISENTCHIDGILHNKFDWISNYSKIQSKLEFSDHVIVDSYYWNETLYRFWEFKGIRLTILDDGRKFNWTHGTIINGGIGSVRSSYPPDSNKFCALTGPMWQPLRKTFLSVPQISIKKTVMEILVYAGGDDLRELVFPLVEIINKVYEKVKIHVMIASFTRNIIDLKQKAQGVFELHIDYSSEEVKSLFSCCDIALVAAGQITYELAYCGIPSILFGTAENQYLNIKGWMESGSFPVAGWWYDKGFFNRILALLHEMSSQETRAKISRSAKEIIDGLSVQRWFDKVRVL